VDVLDGNMLSASTKEECEMELHPGVFVSDGASLDWHTDLEVGGGAEEHVLFDTDGLRAGLTRFSTDADRAPWVLAD
jgi:hypothetical protein